MRDGETEYGRGEGDRPYAAEDLPTRSPPQPPRISDSDGRRSGNGCHKTAFLLSSKAGVLTQRLVHEHPVPTLRRILAHVPSR